MNAVTGVVGALTYEQAQRERTAVVESPIPGGSPAPNNAQYVVLALDATLTQERVLTGTVDQIVVTDNGAGSTVVLSLDSNPIIPGANTPDRVLFTNGAGAVATDSVLKYSTTTNLLDVALGYFQVSQKASASGVPVWLARLVGAVNSSITAGVEAPAILVDLAAQQTWTTSVPTTQRAVIFTAPNYDSTGVSLGTHAATIAIENEPGFGPNSVYSHVWALWVQAGATGLGGGLSVGNLAALTGQPTTGQIRSSALTATRVVFVGASNDLTDDADFTFDGAQLALAVQGATGGVLVGTDVQWYRSAANTWRTPDAVVVDSTLTVSTLAAGATDTVVTHSTGLLQTRTIDSRVWGSTLVDGSGAANQVTYWSDANTVTGHADFTFTTADGVVVNDSGTTTVDFRAEGDTATNLFFIDASLDAVQIGTTTAGALADFRSTVVVFNEPGNDVDFRWESDSLTSLVFLDGGANRVGIGFNAPQTLLHIATNVSAERAFRNSYFAADALGPGFRGEKSRNATVGSHTIVQDGDVVFNLSGFGSNGTTFDPAAAIQYVIDGTPGASADMPGRIEFYTSANGTATLVLRLTINNVGDITHAGTASTLIGLRGATPVAAPDYTVTNPSTDRAFDAAAATLAELRNVVGTIIADLIAVGLFQ